MKRLAALMLAVAILAAGCAAKPPAPAQTAAAALPPGPDGGGSEALSEDEARISRYERSMGSAASQDFSLADLNGKQWTLSELKGKVVLLNFWATWCGPCLTEMPGFQALHERLGEDGGVVILAVASATLEGQAAKAAKASVRELVEEKGFTFPVLFDEDGAVWSVYQQEGIPANYVIDRQGNVRLVLTGAFPDEESMLAALEAVRRAE